MPLIAMAFAEWTCNGGGQKVRWIDAVLDEEDGKLYAVRHKDCVPV